MIKPWRLVLVLVAPLALANCGQYPAPPHPPTKEPSPAGVPSAAPLDPRFQQLPTAAATPSPSAPAVAPPTPVPPPAFPDWLVGDLIVYEAPPRTDTIQRDLYVYNARLNQVVPMPGAGTEADESRPRMSGDRRWMVYQRTAADANQRLRYAAMLFDPIAQQAYPLGTDNGAVDTRAPAISRDGRYVVYVADGAETDQLVLYDLKTGKDYPLPTRSPFALIDSPSFSSDGKRLAFSASARLQNGSADTRDLYFYELATAMVYTLPFANSRGNEDNPVLSSDGKRLLFESDRGGTRDLYQAHLTTGKLDTFSQLNSGRSDETWPAYYGVDDAWIRFKLYPSPQTEPNRFLLQLYNPASTVTNTVPTTPQSPAP